MKGILRRLLTLLVDRRGLTSLGSLSATSDGARVDEPFGDLGTNQRLERKAYPLNAVGPFYSVDDGCIICGAPHAAAPELMAWHKDATETGCSTHCFFKRQPKTADEVTRAIAAMRVSCVENLRYGGTDPVILNSLCDNGLRHLCDALKNR